MHLERFAGGVYVFPAPDGGPLRPSVWRTSCWYPAVHAARLRPLCVHDLKHTGVAFLISADVDPKGSSRRAGHASVAFTLDRYGHLLLEADKQGCKARVVALGGDPWQKAILGAAGSGRGARATPGVRRPRTAVPPSLLLAHPSVDALAQQVGVAAVTRILLDPVHH